MPRVDRESDLLRLRHMQDATREALAFAEGRTRDDLDNDRQLVLSLVKLVEIIGEAANHVSRATQQASPDIPWPDIISMRNRLIHGYFTIDLDRVWYTVCEDLPPLASQVDRAIRRLEPSSE